MNGNMQPNTNRITPKIRLAFLLSIIPEAINKTPINPKITGKICEKIVDPVIAI